MHRYLTDPCLWTIANTYVRSIGLPPMPFNPTPVRPDPRIGRRIADAYHQLPSGPTPNLASHLAYSAFAREIRDQYRHCLASGLSFVPYSDPADDYPTSDEMIRELRDRGRIRVFTGGSDHPFLSADQNWMFRCVHDTFGHAMHGYGFGPSGEENAWASHRRMFTPDAIPALTAETRGQNSWFNFGPHSDRPAKDRPFAEQKASILPQWACR